MKIITTTTKKSEQKLLDKCLLKNGAVFAGSQTVKRADRVENMALLWLTLMSVGSSHDGHVAISRRLFM